MKLSFRLGLFEVLAAVLITAGLVSACQTNPVAHAQTIDQKAYALYGTFVVFEEQAAVIIRQPSVPGDVRGAIRKADAAAKPVADKLVDAAHQYTVIKIELEAGTNSNEKMIIATANLEKWIHDAQPLIEELVRSVGGK